MLGGSDFFETLLSFYQHPFHVAWVSLQPAPLPQGIPLHEAVEKLGMGAIHI